ncbi:MAG: hypothetical protein VX603_07695 [Gemmatimonadota bacterium]|nr:hypothetical protein [Gemmatimonadota bacterium]
MLLISPTSRLSQDKATGRRTVSGSSTRRMRAVRDGGREIYIKNLDGQVCRLTETSEDEFAPAWSLDDKRISLAFNEKDRRQSFLTDVMGENRQRFPAPEYDEIYPKVSLDGSEILVTARQKGRAFHQIYVMNMDGANPRNLSRRSQPNYNGNWSPGESRFFFVSQSPGNNTTAALYTVHADGSVIEKSRMRKRAVFSRAGLPMERGSSSAWGGKKIMSDCSSGIFMVVISSKSQIV